MARIHQEIIEKAGCNVLDLTLTTPKAIKADLKHRLKRQEKALAKTIEKGWTGKEIIEQSIIDLKRTLEVFNA